MMMPTLVQLNEFQSKGILRIKNAVPKELLTSAQKHIDSELQRLGIKKYGSVPAQLKDIHFFQQITKLGQMINHDASLDRLISDELVDFSEKLANSKLESPSTTQLLISLPSKKEWSADHLNWHVDVNASPNGPVPGVQIFVLIREVKIHGGATMAKIGSHLLSKNSFEKRDIPIIEMYGEAGDVFLMDMRIVHSPSINATREIRMMLTKRYMRMT